MSEVKPYRIAGRTGEWEVVIGLEIHAQVLSASKLFSGAATTFGAEPNAQVSLVDAGFPGMLPVLNKHCVEQAVRTGIGLNAEIHLTSVFDRKNYFYADLPAGYQISQYTHPIVGRGAVEIDLKDGAKKTIGITRLHLEQDAGKSVHDRHPTMSLIDLNRAGVALMEIVSEPDMSSPDEAGAYVRKIRSIVRYLETCDGNMAEGSLRCDCNVSVRRPGAELGTRCEIKNVNSVKFVIAAIEYEARRQVEVLEDGGTIKQETRLFDSARGVTASMRSKEDVKDYRYFPDPDLLPLVLDPAMVEEIRRTLPELPGEKKARFIADYGLSAYDAGVLVNERVLADFYEAVARSRDPKVAANWVTGDFAAVLKARDLEIEQSPVSADGLGELIDLISEKTISGKIAKDVLVKMFDSENIGKSPRAIVKDEGLEQVTDAGAIEKVIDAVMVTHADKVAQYRAGSDKLLQFFVGQVMKASGGKANPAMLNDLLRRKLAA
jgi:aspartyl-tRNA(Asn)/glutamyl-tRNA(Gln) amidotransferase subunit B